MKCAVTQSCLPETFVLFKYPSYSSPLATPMLSLGLLFLALVLLARSGGGLGLPGQVLLVEEGPVGGAEEHGDDEADPDDVGGVLERARQEAVDEADDLKGKNQTADGR